MAERKEEQPERERETVVVDKSDNKGPGGLIAIIIGIIVIFLIGWLIVGMLDTADDAAPDNGSETTPTQEDSTDTEVDIDATDPDTTGTDTTE